MQKSTKKKKRKKKRSQTEVDDAEEDMEKHHSRFRDEEKYLKSAQERGRRKSLFEETLMVEQKSPAKRRGSLYANQQIDNSTNEVTYLSRTNSQLKLDKTPSGSRRGSRCGSRCGSRRGSRRGSYIDYETKHALANQKPERKGSDYDISPLLQNMSRKGSFNV